MSEDTTPNHDRTEQPDAASEHVTVVAATNAADAIPLVPYLFGYQITDSLVALGVDRDTGVVLRGLRGDLPGADEPVDQSVANLVDALQTFAADGAIATFLLLGFGPESRVTPLMRGALDAASRGAIPVRDAVRVEGNRYWAYRCDDDANCPPEGHDITAESAGAAALRMLGAPVMPTREEFIGRLRPDTGGPRAEMEAATGDAHRWMATLTNTAWTGRAAVRAAVARYRAGGRLTVDEAARLSVLLDDPEVQAFAYRWIDPGQARTYRDLWIDMARRAVDNVAICLILAAISSYLSGDGTLAGAAIDQALNLDPSHPLARLVDNRLTSGVLPPVNVWQELFREADSAYGDGAEERQ